MCFDNVKVRFNVNIENWLVFFGSIIEQAFYVLLQFIKWFEH